MAQTACSYRVFLKLADLTAFSFSEHYNLLPKMINQKRLSRMFSSAAARRAHSVNFQKKNSFQMVVKLNATSERKATWAPCVARQWYKEQIASDLLECREVAWNRKRRSNVSFDQFDDNHF